ncbi:ABC transporter substrate-binding protein [Reyranella sp.]|uniref:ABC transporter substrate-binding protein n=1 Tax=Reyranella sp. TaxID=1929291 RepID=UPI003BA97CB9
MQIDHKQTLANRLAARFSRRRLMQGLGAGAAAAVLPTAASANGGHIKLAWIDFVDTLDPHFTGYLGAIKIHNNIYNGLLKITYDGEKVAFVPDLAESWKLLDDKTHVFKLHSGVKFHDGEPCDAEAVKWSVERVWKGTPKSPHAWKYEYLESVEVVDPLTVKLTFNKPYAFLPVALTGSTGRAGTIVPRKAVEKYGKDFGRNPVGTGPFKFVSWRENDSIVLERNPDYFEKGLPKLERATFLIMKEASSAVAAMLAGRVDGMSNSPLQFINQLKANPNLKVYGEIEGNYSLIAMNCRRPPFDDVNLRRAVGFAIDRETLIKQAFFGAGIPAYTPISPPMTGFFDKNIAKSGRGQFLDLDKAKAFRAKAKEQGPVEVAFLTSEQGQYGTRVAQTIVPMLDKIGIKAKLELVERATWVSRRNAGEFDMLDMTWSADLDPDETIFPEWHSGKAWNFSGWANPEFDKLVEQAQVILDVKARRDLYVKAEDILMDEAPMAILTHMPEFKILSTKVKGFKYIPADSLDLHTVSL